MTSKADFDYKIYMSMYYKVVKVLCIFADFKFANNFF